ncbi:hypothetical protein A4A49_11611 [Nicotiana attenuata]|uniref:Uncharacterized protein n=1 Tax=Nicotiana attenuata TaxID=49451 RepID=A0A314KP11_NICAT|nr:hypothetical protein A4A49_11611 [Nicotiana attenuata]
MAESDSDSHDSSVGSNTSILNSFAAHDNVNEDEFLNGDLVGNELMVNNDANNVIVDDFLNGPVIENELIVNNEGINVNEDGFLNGPLIADELIVNNDAINVNEDGFLNGDVVGDELMVNNGVNNGLLNPLADDLIVNNDEDGILNANYNVINNNVFMNGLTSKHDEMKNNEDELLNGLIAGDEIMVENGLRSVAEEKINNNNDVVENQLDEDLVEVEGEGGNGLNEQQMAVAQDPIVEVDRQESDSSSSPSDHDTPN